MHGKVYSLDVRIHPRIWDVQKHQLQRTPTMMEKSTKQKAFIIKMFQCKKTIQALKTSISWMLDFNGSFGKQENAYSLDIRIHPIIWDVQKHLLERTPTMMEKSTNQKAFIIKMFQCKKTIQASETSISWM